MKIIGLTGGIGSGKTTVAGLLHELGASVIDADKLGHKALEKGGPAYRQVASAFGPQILDAEGAIDRSKLAGIVFADPEALQRLNRITHPVIETMMEKRLQEYRNQGVKTAVIEAAVMLEAGRNTGMDELWVTVAPQEVVLKRIEGRGGIADNEARARIRAQLGNEERTRHADVVIDTDCSPEELKYKVEKLWRERLAS